MASGPTSYPRSWESLYEYLTRPQSPSTHMDRPGDLEVHCPYFRVCSCSENRTTVRLYGNARPPMRSGTPLLPSSSGSTSTSLLPSPEGHPNLIVQLSRLICTTGPASGIGRGPYPNGGGINAQCDTDLVTSQPDCPTDPRRDNASPPMGLPRF